MDETYRPCRYCGADCPWLGGEEPCWGEVVVVSDFSDPEDLHACEGHALFHYRPRPASEA